MDGAQVYVLMRLPAGRLRHRFDPEAYHVRDLGKYALCGVFGTLERAQSWPYDLGVDRRRTWTTPSNDGSCSLLANDTLYFIHPANVVGVGRRPDLQRVRPSRSVALPRQPVLNAVVPVSPVPAPQPDTSLPTTPGTVGDEIIRRLAGEPATDVETGVLMPADQSAVTSYDQGDPRHGQVRVHRLGVDPIAPAFRPQPLNSPPITEPGVPVDETGQRLILEETRDGDQSSP